MRRARPPRHRLRAAARHRGDRPRAARHPRRPGPQLLPETGGTGDRTGRPGSPPGPQRPGRGPAGLTPPRGPRSQGTWHPGLSPARLECARCRSPVTFERLAAAGIRFPRPIPTRSRTTLVIRGLYACPRRREGPMAEYTARHLMWGYQEHYRISVEIGARTLLNRLDPRFGECEP